MKGAGPATCDRCGKPGHSPDRCYFRSQKCRACGKRGHIAKMCQSKKPTHYVGQEGDSQDGDASEGDASSGDSDAQFLFNIKTLNTCNAGIMLELTFEGKPLSMELDTGAAMTIVSERTWKATFPKLPLRKSTVKLRTYTGEPLEIAGECEVPVVYGVYLATSGGCWGWSIFVRPQLVRAHQAGLGNHQDRSF